MSHAEYLEPALIPKSRSAALAMVRRELKKQSIKFDSVLVIGVSGLTFGAVLAHVLKKKLIVLRKDGANDCHSFHPIELPEGAKNVLILDDLISSGATIENIADILKANKNQSGVSDLRIVGLAMYNWFYVERSENFYRRADLNPLKEFI